MNETFTGATIKDRHVAAKMPASMSVNSEFVSNETDESDLQYEKHGEERI
jgi:hypothetical protein